MSRRGASGGRKPAVRSAKGGARSTAGGPSGAGRKSTGKSTGKNPGKGTAQRPGKKTEKVVFDAPPAVAEEPRTLRVGAVPGATPGRWIDAWKDRMPHVALELVPLAFADQRTALTDGSVDLALVRGPFDAEGMHAIPLYEELAVVIASAESHLLAADELAPADLEGETLLTSAEDALGELDLPVSPARIPPLGTVADAIATAAAGVGIVVAPMSLARLHHRKDVEYRILRGAPLSPVLLAWPADATTPDVEAFVGIVRGRTANSSR
ncbi:LysR substrate-binding domain-containing protein [Microbacterium sp. ASV81]|uniref:LysR substrate-binding domain-containing protein n=1 Tax=Microbacterium capsulatum TaxID=3041921 RepID=A0ABU0XKJ5_9MICO|nr:LysR substrate-binding domain-containing protein [Microbacterium sp. ASV81]MDQ4215667.1 LysR substrate-binding domain-containing protein [Microbacterium sp. ASV81]